VCRRELQNCRSWRLQEGNCREVPPTTPSCNPKVLPSCHSPRAARAVYSKPSARDIVWNRSVWLVRPTTFAAGARCRRVGDVVDQRGVGLVERVGRVGSRQGQGVHLEPAVGSDLIIPGDGDFGIAIPSPRKKITFFARPPSIASPGLQEGIAEVGYLLQSPNPAILQFKRHPKLLSSADGPYNAGTLAPISRR
jgi:hypothetical protein